MKVFTDLSKTKEIKVGDAIAFRNTTAIVVKIRPFGTIDVRVGSNFYRVSGLVF